MSHTPETLVLINRHSGSVRGDDAALPTVFRHGGLDGAEVRVLGDPSRIPELTARAIDDGTGLIVAGGGDGTIHSVANVLLQERSSTADPGTPALAILPLGTANDFARTLGVAELDAALDAIARTRDLGPASAERYDVIRVVFDDGEPVYAVNVAVAGFGGRVQHEVTPELKARWGPLAYLVGGVGAFEDGGRPATIQVDDGERTKIDLFNLAVANGRFAGGGYEAAPGASPRDGRMEVVVASPVDLRGLAVLASYVGMGRAPEHDAVTLRGATRFRIETDEPLDYSLDGEPHSARRADFQLLEGALPIVASD